MPPDDYYSDGFPILPAAPVFQEIIDTLERAFPRPSVMLRKNPPLSSNYDECEVFYFQIKKGEEIHFIKLEQEDCIQCTWFSHGAGRDFCDIKTSDDLVGWVSYVHSELNPQVEFMAMSDEVSASVKEHTQFLETQRREWAKEQVRMIEESLFDQAKDSVLTPIIAPELDSQLQFLEAQTRKAAKDSLPAPTACVIPSTAYAAVESLAEKYIMEYGEDPRDWGSFEDPYY